MNHKIELNLDDNDMNYFYEVMKKAQVSAKELDEGKIISKAKKLVSNIKGNVPDFIQTRIDKLNTIIMMVEDDDWQIPKQEREQIFAALAYFSNAQELVPDDLPVLGFLDDAIMIELVADSLADCVGGFKEFCAYREEQLIRFGNEAVTKKDWLADKRHVLHERIIRHRKNYQNYDNKFTSIF